MDRFENSDASREAKIAFSDKTVDNSNYLKRKSRRYLDRDFADIFRLVSAKRVDKDPNEVREGHEKSSSKRCRREIEPREDSQAKNMEQTFETFMNDFRQLQRVKNKILGVEKELEEKSKKLMAAL